MNEWMNDRANMIDMIWMIGQILKWMNDRANKPSDLPDPSMLSSSSPPVSTGGQAPPRLPLWSYDLPVNQSATAPHSSSPTRQPITVKPLGNAFMWASQNVTYLSKERFRLIAHEPTAMCRDMLERHSLSNLNQLFSNGGPRRRSRGPRSSASLVKPGNTSCIFLDWEEAFRFSGELSRVYVNEKSLPLGNIHLLNHYHN